MLKLWLPLCFNVSCAEEIVFTRGNTGKIQQQRRGFKLNGSYGDGVLGLSLISRLAARIVTLRSRLNKRFPRFSLSEMCIQSSSETLDILNLKANHRCYWFPHPLQRQRVYKIKTLSGIARQSQFSSAHPRWPFVLRKSRLRTHAITTRQRFAAWRLRGWTPGYEVSQDGQPRPRWCSLKESRFRKWRRVYLQQLHWLLLHFR